AVARGGRPVLVEHGWRTYLVKVLNEAGAEATLDVLSPNARPVPGGPREEIGRRWLELSMYDERPMKPRLSGLGLEYRIVQRFSRAAGAREAMLWFDLAGWAGRPEQPTLKWQGEGLIKEWRFFNKGTDEWFASKPCRVESKDWALVVTPTGGA